MASNLWSSPLLPFDEYVQHLSLCVLCQCAANSDILWYERISYYGIEHSWVHLTVYVGLVLQLH